MHRRAGLRSSRFVIEALGFDNFGQELRGERAHLGGSGDAQAFSRIGILPPDFHAGTVNQSRELQIDISPELVIEHELNARKRLGTLETVIQNHQNGLLLRDEVTADFDDSQLRRAVADFNLKRNF